MLGPDEEPVGTLQIDWRGSGSEGIVEVEGWSSDHGERISLKGHVPLGPRGLPTWGKGRWELQGRNVSSKLLAEWLPELPWASDGDGRLAVHLVVRQEEDAMRWRFRGEVRATGLRLRHGRLAPQPVTFPPVLVRAAGDWDPRRGRLRIEQGTVRLDAVQAGFSGAFSRSPRGAPVLALDAELPEGTPCQKVFEAVPAAMRGAALEGFAWEGSMRARLRLHLEPARPEVSRLRVEVHEGCRLVRAPAWAAPDRLRVPFDYRIVGADGSTRLRRSGPGSADWVPLAEVSPFFLHALLAAEDASFFRHAGFAPWAIEEAFQRNLAAGRFVLGASTLSMQLARNLFLSREKTLARKLQEVVLTWWLERSFSKAELLALYVNVVEFGPDLYGIGPAARHYFNREPATLSVAEGAFLASVLPSPIRFHRDFERGELSAVTSRRIERLLRHMAARNRIDETALQEGLAELSEGLRFRDPQEEAAPPRPASLGHTATLPVPHAGRSEPLGEAEFDGDEAERAWEADWPQEESER